MKKRDHEGLSIAERALQRENGGALAAFLASGFDGRRRSEAAATLDHLVLKKKYLTIN